MGQQRTYRVQPEVLAQKRRRVWLLMVLVPVVLLVFALASPFAGQVPLASRLFFFMLIALAADVFLLIQSTLTLQRWAGTTVRIDGGALLREDGRNSEAIALAQLEELIITRGPRKEIVSLRLVAPGRAMHVGGYEDMEGLKDAVHSAAGEVPVSIRRIPIDLNHPLAVAALIAPTLALLAGLLWLDEVYRDLITAAFFLLAGLMLLLTARLPGRNRAARLLLGAMFLATGLVVLVVDLVS